MVCRSAVHNISKRAACFSLALALALATCHWVQFSMRFSKERPQQEGSALDLELAVV
jgi:hypothetical protein